MIRIGCTLVALLLVGFAEAQNPFRTRQTGDWNQSSTWEEFIAGTWQLTGNTPTSASGTISIESPHVVTVTANVTIDQTTIQPGSSLIVNDAIALTLNQAAGTELISSGTLQMLGESMINGGGELLVNDVLHAGSLNATGALVAGNTAGNIRVTNRDFSASAYVIYDGLAAQYFGSGQPSTSGVVTEINNAAGITFDNTTTGNPGGGLIIPGDLIMTTGDIHISTVSGTGRTLILRGTITDNGNNITMSGPCSLRIEGSGTIGTFPFPAGNQSMFNFVMNRPGETLTFANAMSFSGDFLSAAGTASLSSTASVTGSTLLTGGSIDFNGNATLTGSVANGSGSTIFFEGVSLSMANNYISTGGVLSSDGSSTLVLTGATPHTSALSFAGGSSLNTLSMTMNNAGTSVSIGSAVTVTTALNLTDGTLDNPGGNLSLSSGATLTKNSNGSITTSSPSGGPWNLVYTNSSQATGLEIPPSGNLTSLTVSTNGGTTVTLGSAVNVSGAFTINSNGRIFTSGANNVSAGSFTSNGTFNAPTAAASTGFTISGNLVSNSVFNHNSGTIEVAGTSVWSGTTIATTNFFTVNIAASGSFTPPTTLNIVGNMSNAGTFTASGGTVIFRGGTNTLSGATMPTTSFANVTVNTGATLVPSTNFILTGNLVMNGGYTAGTGTTTFAGTSTLSGTSISTTQFNHITINGASTLTSPSNLRVGGDFSNSGTFTAGGTTTVEFNGASSLLGSTINTTNFNNVTINGGATVTAPATFNIAGNLLNNGTLSTGSGTVVFVGTSGAKTLSGTTNTQFFNLTLNKNNGGVSVSVNSAQTVTNALNLLRGIIDNPGGNLSMNSGTTLTRVNLGTITTASPSGGPWNLVYQGSTMTTALEVPASGILTSLTVAVDLARTVNLNQSITVQNALTIASSGRTLACGTNNVNTASFTNNGTITAPASAATTGFTITGGFTNNGTYTHNNGLITFSGNTTLAGTVTPTFNRLTITGTLTAPSNFAMAGHLTNNGTFNAPSLVTFSGAALQNISGSAPTTTFRGMRITNTFAPVSVSVETTINLVDSLSLAANARFDADGSAGTSVFTLLSTSDAPAIDAKICRLPAGAVVQGSVTVQRFFRPADNFDRFFSSPVTNATVAMIQAASPAGSFPVTGGFPGTSFPCTGCNNDGHNFRYYFEPQAGIINQGYKGFILATSNTLTPGVGYDAFMWNGVSNTTLSLRGPINTGTVVLGVQLPSPQSSGTTITHTNNGVPSADGWNLVGNPYPSPIQWNNGAGWTKSNIDPTVWVWDVVGRVWHSYNANTSTGDLTNGVIASGQGFWVYAPAVGAASLSVNETAKSFGVSGTGSYFRTASAGDAKGSKALRISLNKGESTDNSFILIDPQASLGVDQGLDALKLKLGIESVSIAVVSEGRNWGHMALGNELPEVLPLTLFADEAGAASISFEVPDSYAALAGYYLVDTYLSRSALVGSGKPYEFEIITGDPSSQGERFYLSKYPLVEKTIMSTLRLTLHPNPAVDVLHIELNTDQVTEMALLDYAGRPVSRINPVVEDGMTRANVDVSQQPTGLYILKVMAEGNIMTQKLLISR